MPLDSEKLVNISDKPRYEKNLILKQSILYGVDVLNTKSIEGMGNKKFSKE